MDMNTFYKAILIPGLQWAANLTHIENSRYMSFDAQRMLLAIMKQESNLEHRFQVLDYKTLKAGAARGWGQHEQGNISLLMKHSVAEPMLRQLTQAASVQWDAAAIWRAMEGHDNLSVGISRILLWTDPGKLPTDENAAWDCYAERVWKPGKPNREKWVTSWREANKTVQQAFSGS